MRFWFRRDKAPDKAPAAKVEARPPAPTPAPATQVATAPAVAGPPSSGSPAAAGDAKQREDARADEQRKLGFLAKIQAGLRKTNEVLNTPVEDLFRRTPNVSTETLDTLEELLLGSDFGPETTLAIIDAARKGLKRGEVDTGEKLRALVRREILDVLRQAERERRDRPGGDPRVILVVGVNGNGKTTTIGKLAKAYGSEGARVLLAAADTFRAAAIEQLKVWGTRADVPVVTRDSGSDPASVVFDAVREAKRQARDYIIVDTAGRLQNKQPLMAELEKVARVVGREVPGAPHEVLLVIDATTGQNGVAQAREFAKSVPLTGIVLTKLDGTAKGGIVVAVAREFRIPIRFVGVGEKIDDLVPFDPESFVDSLLPPT